MTLNRMISKIVVWALVLPAAVSVVLTGCSRNAAPIAIDAHALAQAYAEDGPGSDDRYVGKMLAITGTVKAVGIGGKDGLITLEGNMKHDILCTFPNSARAGIAGLKPHSHVTIVGKFAHEIDDFTMEQCELR